MLKKSINAPKIVSSNQSQLLLNRI